MTDRNDLVALLEERGAGGIDHPGGNLLDHLIRTSDTLETWGAPRALVVAGLAHAAYGTDGFAVALFDLDERNLLQRVIGEEAEAIVYRYASCDRSFTLPRVGDPAVAFRDRFTGVTESVDPVDLRAFAELTFANELDLVQHSETFRRDNGPAIATLFARWRDLVSAAAYDEYIRLRGSDAAAEGL